VDERAIAARHWPSEARDKLRARIVELLASSGSALDDVGGEA
jgi:hypothetical protein